MIKTEDWGLIDFSDAWNKQKALVAKLQDGSGLSTLILCEHPSVITIGRNGTKNNILSKPEFLKSQGIDIYNIDRGGDVTLHNPGQLVGYPVFNLKMYKTDLHWFLREIESCIIELLAGYKIKAGRVEKLTGVWVENKRKICALGLHCSKWITSHGFALNINNDINQFNFIVPCGISDKEVTSMKQELGMEIDISDVKTKCFEIFINTF
jgi:lipoyl(octanoyl) transferase